MKLILPKYVNYLNVIKSSAMQFYPYLKVDGLNGMGDATTPHMGNRVNKHYMAQVILKKDDRP